MLKLIQCTLRPYERCSTSSTANKKQTTKSQWNRQKRLTQNFPFGKPKISLWLQNAIEKQRLHCESISWMNFVVYTVLNGGFCFSHERTLTMKKQNKKKRAKSLVFFFHRLLAFHIDWLFNAFIHICSRSLL